MLPERNPAVVFQPVTEGAVLLDTRQEIYFGLSEVGARIWELLPPARAQLDQVCEELAIQYPDASRDQLRDDVKELLESLAAEGLVHWPDVVKAEA